MMFSFRKPKTQLSGEKWLAIIVVIWFALFPIAILSSFYYKYHQISTRAVVIHGKITELHPENHNSIKYEYTVSGRTYQGTSDGLADRGFNQDILIYYDPNDPSVSTLGSPGGLAIGMLFSIGFVAILGILSSVAVYFGGQRIRD